MAQRRFHYEQAYEAYLRANRVPYVAVDEARKTLLPADANAPPALKSFDFVIWSPAGNQLVDVKGRRAPRTWRPGRRLETWVTREDVDALEHWQRLFGPDYEAVFVFVRGFDLQPADGWFETVTAMGDRWYTFETVGLADYRQAMVTRSPRWNTVELRGESYQRIVRTAGWKRPNASCRPSPRGLC